MSNKYIINPSSYKNLLEELNLPEGEIIQVNSSLQKMMFINDNGDIFSYNISTSKNGIGSEENSEKTPRGLHRIKEKFGKDAPEGQIFKSREDTGCKWEGEITSEDLILSRILRLEGLEEGINKGGNVDSYKRYIYFHGTNREDLIGTPSSHGCIRMKNRDIIELYDQVKEGTLVFIN